MIAVIRIKGNVGLKKDIAETLDRLRLRKKYSCVVLKDDIRVIGMVNKIKDFVAYGEINDETFRELIEKRGRLINKKKKVDFKKIFDEIKEGKKYQDLNLKPYFSLHPARGGIKTKLSFSQGGVLGNNKEKINDLIKRML
jgi:large subunit ribosomal protein L30